MGVSFPLLRSPPAPPKILKGNVPQKHGFDSKKLGSRVPPKFLHVSSLKSSDIFPRSLQPSRSHGCSIRSSRPRWDRAAWWGWWWCAAGRGWGCPGPGGFHRTAWRGRAFSHGFQAFPISPWSQNKIDMIYHDTLRYIYIYLSLSLSIYLSISLLYIYICIYHDISICHNVSWFLCAFTNWNYR